MSTEEQSDDPLLNPSRLCAGSTETAQTAPEASDSPLTLAEEQTQETSMTDTTVVQPRPETAVITVDSDRHDHGHRGRHDWEQTILREQAAGFRHAQEVAINNLRDINAGFSAASLAACHSDELVLQGAKEAAVGFKDQLVTAYQVEGRQAVQAEKLAAASTLQAEKLSAAASLQAEKLAAATTLQAEKLAAASVLQAEKLAAAAMLAAEKCCCELKEKIATEAVQTRALIDGNYKRQLEIQLQSAWTRNVAPASPTAG